MIKVTIVGSGNVAQHLIKAFAKMTEIELVQVVCRSKKEVQLLIAPEKITDNFDQLRATDVVIIAVSDDAVAQVSSEITLKNVLVVHTSGSIAMDDLDSKNRKGVFYPLQTFSKTKEVNFSQIPIAIEAEKHEDLLLLEKVAKTISNHVQQIDSSQRKALHVAAVFVCNFVNHLYQIGNEICSQNQLPFDLLKPLIMETAGKIMTLPPKEAQTGPAKRKDTMVINKHLNFLKENNHKEIYKLLTQSIIDNGKKL
jgi:predicted short-subunit dehydrogenase-like oxidoreductase (DUF2520 family)